jgi:hypothetical protein
LSIEPEGDTVKGVRPLPTPPNAEKDEESAEVLRAWIIDGGLEISIHPSHWEHQPDQWGRLLADAAEHMADGIAKEHGKSRTEVFNAIRKALVHYLNHPSPDRTGEFLD